MAAKCKEIACECYADESCFDVAGCVASCRNPEDPHCQQVCLTENADGASLFVLANDCALLSCTVACQVSDDALSECERCMFRDCDDVVNACLAQLDCVELLGCVGDCAGEEACTSGCASEYPESTDELENIAACVADKCTRCN